MERNNTWQLFLIIGVAISILGFSCGKIVDPARFGEFYFVNNTVHEITFKYKNSGPPDGKMQKYNIAPNSITSVKQTQESNPTAIALDFDAPFYAEGGYPDPLTVKFDNVKCLTVTRDSERTPLNIANYASEELGKRKYKFTYTFTEADYERAEVCP